MSKGLYIAAMEPNSGKSLVVLGVVELLSTRVQNLGFFRPVVHDDPKMDRHIRLIRDRYRPGLLPEQMFGVGHVEARRAVADGNESRLQKRILERTLELPAIEKCHAESIYGKLGVRGRRGAVAKATGFGIFGAG